MIWEVTYWGYPTMDRLEELKAHVEASTNVEAMRLFNDHANFLRYGSSPNKKGENYFAPRPVRDLEKVQPLGVITRMGLNRKIAEKEQDHEDAN